MTTNLTERHVFRCKHGHNGYSHPQCFNRDTNSNIGFADIEASNLNATFGICYTYCIIDSSGKLIKRCIELDDLYNGIYDKNLLNQFCEDAKQFDRLVFHYGTDRKFDIPFLRTRCVKFGLPFPEYKMLSVSDTYNILKNKFKLHSNRLETACNFFDIPCKQHKLNPDIWLEMITGNKDKMKHALDYILQHNIEDVKALRALWYKINKYTKLSKTSI